MKKISMNINDDLVVFIDDFVSLLNVRCKSYLISSVNRQLLIQIIIKFFVLHSDGQVSLVEYLVFSLFQTDFDNDYDSRIALMRSIIDECR